MTGPGPVKTYLVCDAAGAVVDADVRIRLLAALDDVLAVPELTITSAGFEIEDYLVVGGVPTGVGEYAVRMRSRSVMGDWLYSDAPPAPSDVDTGATCRWLPTDSTFAPDGSSWLPAVGGGLSLVSDNAPYLDGFYSFQVRGGDEVELPAVIFDGDAGMRLPGASWNAPAFTFVLVAVMHPNPEGKLFGLLESYTPPPAVDPGPDAGSNPTDWGVRYCQGEIQLWADATVLSHVAADLQARPIVLAISMSSVTGNLLICDRTKSTRSFSTADYSMTGIDMLIGQTGSGAANETAYMDVLEIDYYDRALTFEELADCLHLLDSIYGVVD